MFWAQYFSTVQNNTLKSNCLMNSHFVIKNFILSSMKMLKELFIDWSVSIYQCKTKFYKKACYDTFAVWPVQNTGTQPYTDSCFVPASTQWCSIGFRQEYVKKPSGVHVHLAEFQFCLIVPSLLNSLLCLNQMNLYMLKYCCLMLESWASVAWVATQESSSSLISFKLVWER